MPAPDLQDVIDGTNIWKALLQTQPRIETNESSSSFKGSRKRGCTSGGDDNPDQDPAKGDPGKEPPGKQVRKANLKEVPEGFYVGICPKCAIVVPNHTADGCQVQAIARNWGLLLLQAYAPDHFQEVQDAVCQYLNDPTAISLCTLCQKQCHVDHNPLICAKELEAYIAEGTLNWRIGKRRHKVNTCICPGTRHQHVGYEEARQCYLRCDGAQSARKQEIQKLLAAGGNPCPQCGDVFADHTVANCVKYSYSVAGDDGFQNALNEGAYVVLERLEGLHELLTKGVPEGTPCVSCAGSEEPHDYRGCLKRLKCKKGADGTWVSEPPGDPAGLPRGRFQMACTVCGSLIPDHQAGDCRVKRTVNYGLLYLLERERPIKIIAARTQKCKYLNGGLDLLKEVCKSCDEPLVKQEGGKPVFHDPEQCLNRWVVYRTKEGALKIRPRVDEPITRCISSQHTHTTWEVFMKCQDDYEERQGLIAIVQRFKGDERRWCQRCTDYFAEHREEECPWEDGGNPTLAKYSRSEGRGTIPAVSCRHRPIIQARVRTLPSL